MGRLMMMRGGEGRLMEDVDDDHDDSGGGRYAQWLGVISGELVGLVGVWGDVRTVKHGIYNPSSAIVLLPPPKTNETLRKPNRLPSQGKCHFSRVCRRSFLFQLAILVSLKVLSDVVANALRTVHTG